MTSEQGSQGGFAEEGGPERKVYAAGSSGDVGAASTVGSFLYVHNEVIAADAAAAWQILGINREDGGGARGRITEAQSINDRPYARVELADHVDPLAVVESNPDLFELNHGLFAHHAPHPSQVPHNGRLDPRLSAKWIRPQPVTTPLGAKEDSYSGMRASPLHMNPLHMNPLHANPLHMNPLHMNPLHMNPLHMNGLVSTAIPTTPKKRAMGDGVPTAGPQGEAQISIYIIDTGLGAQGQGRANHASSVLPLYATIDGDSTDLPNSLDAWSDDSRTTQGRNFYVDPVAGHGTFIAGIYGQILRGNGDAGDIHAAITVRDGIDDRGLVDEWTAATTIENIASDHDSRRPGVLNLSFGGTISDFAEGGLNALREAIDRAATGLLVVASAGNVSSSARHYPAAFTKVIGVGALDADGVAWFSNYGTDVDPWVDCWAPGVDIISPFLRFNAANWKSPLWARPGAKMKGFFKSPVTGRVTQFTGFDDPNGGDDYRSGWVAWSGTSFAAPIVGAYGARLLVADSDLAEVRQAVLDEYALDAN